MTSQNIQNNAKLQNWSNYNELLLFDVKTIKTTQNYHTDQITMDCIDLTSKQSEMLRYVAKLRKWSNYSALHPFDVKTIRNVQWRHKIFKTTQNYKTDQITMNCCYLMSKRSKQLKTTTLIKLQWIASIWLQNNPKCWDTSQNYESDQIIVHCIDLTSKRSIMLRYVAKHSKQRKTTKVIKL